MNLLTLKHTNMKKILFAAVAALAITSCSQNEEIDAPHKRHRSVLKLLLINQQELQPC